MQRQETMSLRIHRFTVVQATRRPIFLLVIALLFVAGGAGLHLLQADPTPWSQRAPAAIERGSVDDLAQLEMRLQRNPGDANAFALLGQALLQQVRETGDVSLYTRAGQAFTRALDQDPKQLDAIIGQGMLALALHDFHAALRWADQAWALNPLRAQTLGVKVDALVELGRYDEAVTTLQQMVDLRPDLASYTRVSYLRELHGEVEGAIDAMSKAAGMTMPGSEQWLWTMVQLGHLYWNSGQIDDAEQVYRQALQLRNDYPYALAGVGRIQAARGNFADAIKLYEQLTRRLPLPEFVVTLGELYTATGQLERAAQQYDLVRTMQKLNAASGMNVDLELATFEVNYGSDPMAALAQAQAAYAERPTIYAADTLAWAFYRTGNYASAGRYSAEALRLGTRDALLHFHAGMIAVALGETVAAQQHLRTALDINPYFSLTFASEAQEKLVELENR
jgi:tetratricopeptide (TPR) repeat protein